MYPKYQRRNTPAFTAASYFALAAGLFLYCFGIYNAEWQLNVKGYYLLCMFLITITSIVTQKVIRDNAEDKDLKIDNPKHRMRNTPAFTGMAIVGLIIGFVMFFIGLFNASFELNVKGYYIAVMLLISYSSIGVQKVVRDNVEDKEILENQNLNG
ncbi:MULTISPECIES: YiaA/YiaB family inner membrane protein [unclassified Paenibacillus]|uniref:YiaA/YiaB family inner membrane protein n=1 Tax=unclassified Paenibacillus TaxID=185978 RepID=UPI002782CD9F|nr:MULTISPECIES: YiaA/YiaB family inner membrane protein [unclassified Paenibacillus]MDQ0896376.1 putative membrane protein YiaA [Paenibacillus sp. V4I7]MDQ0914080.1 putative membrane protein YiaA [Paenibacillus sp. V4I5]